MIEVTNIILKPQFSNADLKNEIAKKLKIDVSQILKFVVLKQSIDARRKPAIKILITVAVELKNKINVEGFNFVSPDFSGLEYKKVSGTFSRPVVVGFGPAGMFAALALSLMGLKPIVIEQGKCVEEREQDVFTFWKTGTLNPTSNVQFGEGGAGTFSDGKLNTNINNAYCKKVLNQFVLLGAPQQILYVNKPHIGSDNLKVVVKNFRNKILSLGGTILFNKRLESVSKHNDKIAHVVAKNLLDNGLHTMQTDNLVLAVGHSARQTFEHLHATGFNLQQKPFAMGVRIEQLQADINLAQYGVNAKTLPSADYKLVTHLPNGRSVFTFCMCPGGVVVNSSDTHGQIVTNGMSNFLRAGTNANSAILVNVTPSDYGSAHPLAGVEFQKKYEELAFNLTKNFACPAQTVGEFLTEKKCEPRVTPSTKIEFANLKNCLPNFVYESIKMALPIFNGTLKNFAHSGNLLIGVETRSSSPLTIVRNENFESNIAGVYPCGEGAGYAGGIVSSAIDGIKVAEAIYKKLTN